MRWWSLGTIEYDRDAFSEAAEAFRKLAALDSKAGSARIMLGLSVGNDGEIPHTTLARALERRLPRFQTGFVDLLRGFAAAAIERQELPADEDPARLCFELNGILLAADASFVLHDNPAVLDLAREVVRRRLGLSDDLRIVR